MSEREPGCEGRCLEMKKRKTTSSRERERDRERNQRSKGAKRKVEVGYKRGEEGKGGETERKTEW